MRAVTAHLFVWALLSIGNVHGFSVTTHAAMSLRAMERAQIMDMTPIPAPINRFGLLELYNLRSTTEAGVYNIFGSRYFDFVDSIVYERFANSPGFTPPNYELNAFEALGMGDHFLTLSGWVTRGAIREDDHPFARGVEAIPEAIVAATTPRRFQRLA